MPILMRSKNGTIVESLRRDIVQGRFPPGSRLASHRQLSRQWGVSTVTVQTALKQLEREGFVTCDPRRGCFVAERPPHLSACALIFWNDPEAPDARFEWSRYSQALAQAAAEFEAETGRRIIPFYGIRREARQDSLQRLVECVESHTVAGLIFVNAPHELAGTPVLETPGMPRVSIASGTRHRNIRAVAFDRDAWMAKAFDYLASLGRRRVAALFAGSMPSVLLSPFMRAVQERGMRTCSRWIQYGCLHHPEGVQHATELLMADRERPDALVITDDNLVEPALAGLVAAGVEVPGEIPVVAHANWPRPPAKTLPIRLLGYDQRTTVRTCVDLIDRWRQGEVPPEITRLPALWEEDVAEPKKPMGLEGASAEDAEAGVAAAGSAGAAALGGV